MNIRLFIQRPTFDVWGDLVQIFAYGTRTDGKRFAAKPVEFEEVPQEMVIEPQAMMTVCTKGAGATFLQNLMDQLWQLGIRPSDIGTPGHLAATTKHLEDMRAIVASTLDTKLP